jgi:hypothetical protein
LVAQYIFDPNLPESFVPDEIPPQNPAGKGEWPPGHKLHDTMWPWNGVTLDLVGEMKTTA